jgi:hypothetical protein
MNLHKRREITYISLAPFFVYFTQSMNIWQFLSQSHCRSIGKLGNLRIEPSHMRGHIN